MKSENATLKARVKALELDNEQLVHALRVTWTKNDELRSQLRDFVVAGIYRKN